jgi:hypothetical protein
MNTHRVTEIQLLENDNGKRIHKNQRHGMLGTPTYRSWFHMWQRCRNKNSKDYPRWGGRGVRVCERWEDFRNFLADMGERPAGKTLDRYPNQQGNYEPGNCRWATKSEQVWNSTAVRLVPFNGESLPVSEWARRTGISRVTLEARLLRGWPVERALTEPTNTPAARKAV